MNLSNYFLRLQARAIWSNPERKIQTLESFSQTEIDAGESICRALKHVEDLNLRTHLERHAEDELRHGELFRTRAHELRALSPNTTSISKKPDKLYSLSRENIDANINSHGFFTSDSFETLGEIKYVAMLNIAEKKAEQTFKVHLKLLRNDAITQQIFTRILKDERYHVSYTNKFLQQWRKEGNEQQVNEALKYAKRSRFVNTLTRKTSKFGEHIGHGILYLIYFTLIIPFALLSKLSQRKRGWNSPESSLHQKKIHSQY